MKKKLRVEKFKRKYFNDVKRIYVTSFPKEERFPIIVLLWNLLRKRSELYVLLEEDKLCAFLYLIKYKEMTFILYLAVDTLMRNKGYGGYLLDWILEKKNKSNIYLNIDEIDDIFEDNAIRKKRLKFYLSHHFLMTDYLSLEKNENFNILTTEKEFLLDEYIKLDKKISLWFFNGGAKIVKMKK